MSCRQNQTNRKYDRYVEEKYTDRGPEKRFRNCATRIYGFGTSNCDQLDVGERY